MHRAGIWAQGVDRDLRGSVRVLPCISVRAGEGEGGAEEQDPDNWHPSLTGLAAKASPSCTNRPLGMLLPNKEENIPAATLCIGHSSHPSTYKLLYLGKVYKVCSPRIGTLQVLKSVPTTCLAT